MLSFLKRKVNTARTENGGNTLFTSGSDCLDFFATIGALRHASDEEIKTRFLRAFAENPSLALKTLFFARDVRGGLGERRIFRTVLVQLAENMSASILKNIHLIPEYGRFDDLLVLLDTPCKQEALRLISNQYHADMAALKDDKNVSLLGKWLPSVNASSLSTVKKAKTIARSLHLSDVAYRKSLTALRAKIAIIENNLRLSDYTFSYANQPSRAMMKYRKAFLRNDAERYQAYLEHVLAGQEKLKTGGLMPYEIVRPLLNSTVSIRERMALDATWKAMEDFTNNENALVVVDGSGSMYQGGNPLPATVALSMGIYFAERNRGAFQNHFITFSNTPQLIKIKGADIFEKVQYCASYNEITNTDIQKVFNLILDTAAAYHVPQSQMPGRLYIVSDMEFDACVGNGDTTHFRAARKAFARRGYKLPQVVFWNVSSRNRHQPVSTNEQGAALVSGASPRIFQMATAQDPTPFSFMMQTLNSERYAAIQA